MGRIRKKEKARQKDRFRKAVFVWSSGSRSPLKYRRFGFRKGKVSVPPKAAEAPKAKDREESASEAGASSATTDSSATTGPTKAGVILPRLGCTRAHSNSIPSKEETKKANMVLLGNILTYKCMVFR